VTFIRYHSATLNINFTIVEKKTNLRWNDKSFL